MDVEKPRAKFAELIDVDTPRANFDCLVEVDVVSERDALLQEARGKRRVAADERRVAAERGVATELGMGRPTRSAD